MKLLNILKEITIKNNISRLKVKYIKTDIDGDNIYKVADSKFIYSPRCREENGILYISANNYDFQMHLKHLEQLNKMGIPYYKEYEHSPYMSIDMKYVNVINKNHNV